MASAHARTTISVFDADVSSSDAVRTLLETDDELVEATTDGVVYYPYRVFGFDLHAEALLDEFDDRVYCGVDLCNDKEMFIDEKPTPTEYVVDGDAVVPPSDDVTDPEQTARRYLFELARKEFRVGSPPDLTVVKDRRIHRPFHVVDCETADETFLTYVVDGVTGGFHRIYLD
jgi:hypothetical protein